MLAKKLIFLSISILCLGRSYGQTNIIKSSKDGVILSAIKGTTSRVDTIILSSSGKTVKIKEISITGPQASYFKLTSSKSAQVSSSTQEKVAVVFAPSTDFTGLAKATLQIKGPDITIPLTGLSTKGLEGENEATLAKVIEALGLKTNIGWTTLANHLQPELQGEELPPALFTKAGTGKVEMIPVARYSPDFLLNFGYYTRTANGPFQRQAGILAKADKFPEHQILFPALAKGEASFDPGNEPFGFYAISPGHTLYSEDVWNILFYPTHAAHAIRIFPVKDNQGKAVSGNYLVCMEEAANGDYNDYVFLVKNVKPVYLSEKYSTLFNGKNLDGWYTWLQSKGKNNDPEKIFTVEDGIIHDLGKEVGYIMTDKSFNNFHFILEFKWGEKKWPPRDNLKRDSGICYNVPADETDKIWPASVECQIQEGDVGDFWLIGNSTIQVDKKQNAPSAHTQIIKKKDAEKPNGEWNIVEVISFQGKCVHIVNGVVVNYGENSSLIGGKILLQSEYAEVYYRNVRILEL